MLRVRLRRTYALLDISMTISMHLRHAFIAKHLGTIFLPDLLDHVHHRRLNAMLDTLTQMATLRPSASSAITWVRTFQLQVLVIVPTLGSPAPQVTATRTSAPPLHVRNA